MGDTTLSNKQGNPFSRFIDGMKQSYADFKKLEPKEKRKAIFEFLINNALYILIVILVIFVQSTNSKFLSPNSIVNILTQSSTRLIMALGVAGIIVLTGTDLSAGRIMGLSACICASLLQAVDYPSKMYPDLPLMPLIVPLLIVMAVGAILGAFNGFCVAKFKLHPFIVTLGTQLMIYGLILIYVGFGTNAGAPIGGLDRGYVNFVNDGIKIGELLIPNVIFYAIFITIIMWFVWNKTKLGKNIFAVGCNPDAANVSGVSVTRTIITVFCMAGLLYGVSGFLESARVGSNTAATGFNYELDAIAACVIGGVSFMGGIGKIKGVIMGVILLQLINASLVFLGVEANLQTIVKGAIILIACAIDMRKYLVRK